MGHCCSKTIVTFKEGKTIKQLKNNIKPLDLIIFRGSDFVSDTISLVENLGLGNGNWTHVGLVVTTDIMPIKNGVKDKLYIWESTIGGNVLGIGLNDIEINKTVFGVQIRDLEEVVDKYDNNENTRIGWCKLLTNPIDKDIENVKNIITSLHENIGNATYDYNCCNLLSTICNTCSNERREIFGNPNMYFCSELVAKIYIELGIIPKYIDPEKIAPVALIGHTKYNFPCPVQIPPVHITREWNISN
jgi:hypothetical protein